MPGLTPFLTQRIYDACQAGTISLAVARNWHMTRLAVFHSIKVAAHNSTVALGTMCNTHLFAGMPSGFVCEFFMYPNNPWRDVPFKKPMGPKNGYISLHDRSGFRMEPNDLSKRYS